MTVPASLTIGEISRQTGVAPSTLRMWESRYGFPEPIRSSSGHRRYRAADVAVIGEVTRQRAAGLSLGMAIQRARGHSRAPARSIFAELHRARPDLSVQRLRKPVMLAMSHAIEDECLARASRALLVASFQEPRYFRPAAARWRRLAVSAGVALVLADFERSVPEGVPPRIAVAAGEPAAREWTVACLAEDFCACLAGWELPADPQTSEADRRFEAIWTIDAGAVASAIRTAAALARVSSPQVAALVEAQLDAWDDGAANPLRVAESLVNRALGHLSGATARPPTDGPPAASRAARARSRRR